MSDQALLSIIQAENSVSRDQIAESKLYILANFQPRPEQMLHALLATRDLAIQNPIDLINNSMDIYGTYLAKCSSWWNAGVQALWELQGQGVFNPTDTDIVFHIDSIPLISGNANSRTQSTIHLRALFNPTYRSLQTGVIDSEFLPLSNSDIFIKNLTLTGFPDTVSSDLGQASECFRRELYLPTLVMLGRAIEGAWISVANALIQYITDEKEANQFESTVNDEYLGVSGKINAISDIYSNKKYFGKIQHESGTSIKKMGAVRQWSEQLLSYRNAIHPGAEPAIDFNYETVSVIMMSVKGNFTTLDNLLTTANQSTD